MKVTKIRLLTLIFTVVVLMLDVVSKKLAVFYEGENVHLLGDFFWFEFYQTNTGIAFSLPVPRWIQIVLTFVILIILIHSSREWIFNNKKHPFLKLLLFGMLLGGALGNLVDRIFQSYVVDFIHLGPIPTFNVADIGIVVGVIGLVLVHWLENNNKINLSENSLNSNKQ